MRADSVVTASTALFMRNARHWSPVHASVGPISSSTGRIDAATHAWRAMLTSSHMTFWPEMSMLKMKSS